MIYGPYSYLPIVERKIIGKPYRGNRSKVKASRKAAKRKG